MEPPDSSIDANLRRLLAFSCTLWLLLLAAFCLATVAQFFRGTGFWAFVQTVNAGAGNIITAAVAVIAFIVAFCAFDGTRLDHFVTDVESRSDRKRIFDAYCSLPNLPGKSRREQFKELLQDPISRIPESPSEVPLGDICDENVRLFSRVGARLPWAPPFRTRALEWHVVVFLWLILGRYVIARRRQAGPSFAKTFVSYALASTEVMLEQRRDEWTIVDPNFARKNNVVVTRAELWALVQELKDEKWRTG